MKRQAKFILWLSSMIFMAKCGLCDPLDISKAMRYTPPTNFVSTVVGSDDNIFGGNLASSQYSSSDQCSTIVFQLSLACFNIGEGKVIKFLPAKPTNLQENLENEFKGKLPNLTPAVIGKLDGLTDVSLTATRPNTSPAFFHFCWIQLETNIVVKVTAVSCDAETFKALTNSIQSLKIDRKKLLKAWGVTNATISQ
jgi:hypothetical protein